MATLKPNFFLVGAAKCGTTSMSRYLGAHPQVFFSPRKEPHYFSTDYYEPNRVWTEREYMRLFDRARPEHLAIGEGSVWYIASQVAPGKILQFNPAAKFIAMVRSPLEMVRAVHAQNLFDCIEDQPDFELAWRSQASRREGREIPFLCCEPRELMYSERCMLGTQLDRLMRTVPRERIKVIVMDDMRVNPRAVYEEIISFLGLPSDHRTDFPVYNENKVPRWPMWNRLIAYGGKIKHKCRVRKSFAWGDFLIQFNTAPAARQPIRPEFQEELSRHFTRDVELLSRLLDRDLTAWLRPVEQSSRVSESRPRVRALSPAIQQE
jgi:sulfotransferase family protein